jgi:hypothetical protein
VDGVAVAEYVWCADLPAVLSPRPYLHPVRTLAGVEVTQAGPADHTHHLGAGVAIADVGGTNFWGGRTFVRGAGPSWLDNHGTQRHVDFVRRDESGFTETVEWLRPGGATVLRERRSVTAAPVVPEPAAARPGLTRLPRCWLLDFTFVLTNVTGSPLAIRSSATRGRPGAGYGGFFWRAPGSSVNRRVFAVDGEGEAAVHGRRSPWLAMCGTTPVGQDWTLVFRQAPAVSSGATSPDPSGATARPSGRSDPADGTVDDPWFTRVADYPGIGAALAWDRALVVDRDVTRRVVTLIVDGRLGHPEVRELVRWTP